MYPSTSPSVRLQKWLWIPALLVVVWCGYTCYIAVRTAGQTGILDVRAPSAASVSVSQPNHQAVIIGAGSTKLHLKPGIYHVAASSNGKESTAIVEVRLKQSSLVQIDTSKTNALPSIQDVDFQNTDALINSGLSTTQISALEQQFFQFDKSAKTVTISSGTVQPGAHNIDTDGATFRINFQVLVDSKLYRATATYSGLDTARLFLYDYATQTPVFDGGQ